ncbi:MAG: hypothetical protein KatS3mg038_3835 [Candidatus Kapaibacterium sp.]|nr:MAG: hypothetical protein KatS3mg038_0348 [Candidatus Kapabacteria bacterium]GIV50213.1 MAG: hypothetical protein KatS3mg038_0734 [Candidatus Kapabacteria bacterium]GIV51883.1 MAG: hypothetical protein KatS3mg038_2404 [Candidatus Kapabacteria bacterium]GIV52578.1 MAG: hypothetical protein KatS3mg038_3099 [Candidatus Kapabacteria bacterium]GIV53314.1 MAG: hypothetical protein KatS3mg038_3835 [Candidatus Kapabacteria bacterium]
MADVYAIANGNWSDPAIWSGSTVPGTADNVWLNGKTITLDQDISVASLSSEANATLGTVAGGTLDIPSTYSTRSITASGDITHGGNVPLITFTKNTNLTITASTIYSSTSSGTQTVNLTTTNSSIQLIFNANLVARSSYIYRGPDSNFPNITINGNTKGYGQYVLYWSFHSGAIVINGNAKNGLVDATLTSPNITINGNIIIENDSSLLCLSLALPHASTNHQITVNGNIYGGNVAAIKLSSNPQKRSVVINGSIVGGTATNVPALQVTDLPSDLSIRINGDIIAGTALAASGIGASIGATGGRIVVNGNLKVQSGTPPGVPPVWIPDCIISNVPSRHIEQWEADLATNQPTGNKLIFETNINASQANPADVRQGVVYGPAGEYTGTLAVPPPQAVAYGVPVDNTVGQAGLPPYRAVAEYRGG